MSPRPRIPSVMKCRFLIKRKPWFGGHTMKNEKGYKYAIGRGKMPVNKEGEKPFVSLVSHQTAQGCSNHGDTGLQGGCRPWASTVGDSVRDGAPPMLRAECCGRGGGFCPRTPGPRFWHVL